MNTYQHAFLCRKLSERADKTLCFYFPIKLFINKYTRCSINFIYMYISVAFTYAYLPSNILNYNGKVIQAAYTGAWACLSISLRKEVSSDSV